MTCRLFSLILLSQCGLQVRGHPDPVPGIDNNNGHNNLGGIGLTQYFLCVEIGFIRHSFTDPGYFFGKRQYGFFLFTEKRVSHQAIRA